MSDPQCLPVAAGVHRGERLVRQHEPLRAHVSRDPREGESFGIDLAGFLVMFGVKQQPTSQLTDFSRDGFKVTLGSRLVAAFPKYELRSAKTA